MASPRAKVLVVDDDRDFISILQVGLSKDSYEVEAAHDAWDGLRRAYAFQPDVILLDILMPGMDGWDMLRRIRELSDVPVIMVSAIGGEDAKVHGFDLGADDYVTKPFGMPELNARIQAVLRRAALPPSNGQHVLRLDGDQLVIDPGAHRVVARGKIVDLTPTEYKLLLYLAYNAGRVLTQGQILDGVWGPGYEQSLNSVKVYIRRLRSKVEEDPNKPRYIMTQRGSGYFLVKR
jgi:DNA-binding response OmpR family regulator